jgi:hypothetical protein
MIVPMLAGKQGIAVGRSFRRTRCADCTAGAADVLDYDVVAKVLAHAIRRNAGDDVARARRPGMARSS